MDNKYMLGEGIIFNAKPDAVPYNYRLSYKMGQLCLIMAICCARGGCSEIKLHIISFALISREYFEQINKYIENPHIPYLVPRFDPSINRTVSYALSDKLIYRQGNGLLRLTEKGKKYIQLINKDKELLNYEKNI